VAHARIPQKVGIGFAIEYTLIFMGAFSCGKPVSTLPENALNQAAL
jgi:hypothetical protein